MSEKIIGYLLLSTGLIIMLLSAFSVYQVFTSKAEPIQLFNFKAVAIDVGSIINAPENLINKDKKAEIISADMINQTSNIAAHMFLMGFVVTVGYKVSSLGIMLLRPINVKVKEEKAPVLKSS